jgi:prevent-host-death family protein
MTILVMNGMREESTMKTAAVAELKASLSKYLAQVKGGGEVLITERGKPVAKLVPVTRETSSFPPHLLDLERAGLVRLGTSRLPDDFWKLPRWKDRRGRALKALLAEREEGR